MPRLALTALLGLLVALLCAAPAAASPYDDYRDDGQINPCDYSDGELRQTLDSLPPDVLQYSPGLADQLAAGREGCGGGAPGSTTDPRQYQTVPPVRGSKGGGGGSGGGGVPGAGGALANAKIPEPPAPGAAARTRLAEIATPPVSASTRSDVPGWVIALLVAAALAGILFALARTSGLETDRLLRPLRGSFGEAGGRTADAAAQLFDSVRLGR
jgi:hypothetical protein